MLTSVLHALADVNGVECVTTWDHRLASPPAHCRVLTVQSEREEWELFERLAAQADQTLVIAPEFDSILESRVARVADDQRLNAAPQAIAVCADKLALADRWIEAGVPTVPTRRLTAEPALSFALPVVLKPRYGAGSIDTRVVTQTDELAHAAETSIAGNFLLQPLFPGESVSVAAIVGGSQIELLPTARQHISDDGRLRYLGGTVPFHHERNAEIALTAKRAIAAIPGLHGYVGVDLIVPDDEAQPVVALELNPRLTTTFAGYARLMTGLGACLLAPGEAPSPVLNTQAVIEFSPDG